jgi:hypothetical protein
MKSHSYIRAGERRSRARSPSAVGRADDREARLWRSRPATASGIAVTSTVTRAPPTLRIAPPATAAPDAVPPATAAPPAIAAGPMQQRLATAARPRIDSVEPSSVSPAQSHGSDSDTIRPSRGIVRRRQQCRDAAPEDGRDVDRPDLLETHHVQFRSFRDNPSGRVRGRGRAAASRRPQTSERQWITDRAT